MHINAIPQNALIYAVLGLDATYTTSKEFIGYPEAKWCSRCEGRFIGCSDTKEGAEQECWEHAKNSQH